MDNELVVQTFETPGSDLRAFLRANKLHILAKEYQSIASLRRYWTAVIEMPTANGPLLMTLWEPNGIYTDLQGQGDTVDAAIRALVGSARGRIIASPWVCGANHQIRVEVPQDLADRIEVGIKAPDIPHQLLDHPPVAWFSPRLTLEIIG